MTETLQVIVLSSAEERGEFFRRLASRNGFRVRCATRLEQAALMVEPGRGDVLVCDETGFGFSWRDGVALMGGQQGAGGVLVVLRQFDGARWVEVLRGGARDVVAEPLRAEVVLAALEVVAGEDAWKENRGVVGRVVTLMASVRRWFGGKNEGGGLAGKRE